MWTGWVDDSTTSIPLRLAGSTYVSGLTPGRIISPGVVQDPNHPEVKLYRIRSDFATASFAELARDAAATYLKPLERVTTEDIVTLREQYRQDWENWPVDIGAPFIDHNSNGIWDAGIDEPGISGYKQLIWFVTNDLDSATIHGLSGAPALELETQFTLWTHASPALKDIIFRRARLINKSAFDINDMYLGQWSDTDIMNFGDDLLASDSLRSMAYSFDDLLSNDNIGLTAGYALVQGPLVESPDDTALFDFRQREGWRNLPARSFAPRAAGDWTNIPLGDYNGTLAWYNWLRGFTPTFNIDNPTPYTVGTGPRRLTPTFWPLSGDPTMDPLGIYGDIDGQGGNYRPGDRALTIANGPFTLAKGDTQEVIWALVGQLSREQDRNRSIAQLRSKVDQLQTIFQNGTIIPEIISDIIPGAFTSTVHVLSNFGLINDISSVSLQFYAQSGDDEGFSLMLYDDGQHNDGAAGDGLWGSEHVEINNRAAPFNASLTYVRDGREIFINDAEIDLSFRPAPQLVDLEVIWENGPQDKAINPGETVHLGFSVRNADQLSTIEALQISGIPFQINSLAPGATYQDNRLFFVNTAPTEGDSLYQNYTLTFDDHYLIRSLSLPLVPWQAPGVWQDTLETTSLIGTNKNVIPIVADVSLVTGDRYQIEFLDNSPSLNPLWRLTNLNTGMLLLDNQPLAVDPDFQHPIVDGIIFQVSVADSAFEAFQTVANAAGPIDPPTQGAFAFSGNGFPTHDGQPLSPGINDRPDAARQQTNGSTWGIHTGGTNRSLYETFLSRVLRNTNSSRAIPYDFEIRFTADSGYANWAFETGEVGKVPFELWNTGINTPNDPSDDYRMVPWVLNEADFGTGPQEFNINRLDHAVSGANNDPYTDWIYFRNPEDTSPGDAGYQQFVADGLAGTYDFGGEEVMARLVLVNWNGGDVEDPNFPDNVDALMPEVGTIFRIITKKTNIPGDQIVIDTAPVGIGETSIPTEFALFQNYPNPFNPSTTIRYTLPAPAEVKLSIYNILGQRVRFAVGGQQLAGEHAFLWNGKNDAGSPVASGVYFYRLKAGEFVKTRKMMLLH